MRATAGLSCTTIGRLRAPRAIPAVTAALGLTARGRLCYPTPIQGRAALSLAAHAIAPRGLGATLDIVRDQYTSAILKQTLRVWVRATPPRLRLALSVDGGPAIETGFIRENPTGGLPAVFTLQHEHLPTDGFTHRLTVSAWTASAGHASATAVVTLRAKLAAAPVPIPEWVGARIVRQNSTEFPDLIDVSWRAATAVILLARLRQPDTPPVTVRFGTADSTEGHLRIEGIGQHFWNTDDDQLYPVDIGIIGLQQGQESPVRWCSQPLLIQNSDGTADTGLITPDTLAQTAVTVKGVTVAGLPPLYNPLRASVETLVRATFGTLPANASTIIDKAISHCLFRIKNHVRQDEAVILDDLGVFSARWTAASTRRQRLTGIETVTPPQRLVAFKPALGYTLGTRAGTLLTDQQARDITS